MPLPPPDLVLRRATLGEILALRRDELRPGRALDEACLSGDDAPDTAHVGAFLGPTGPNVGCASFMRGAFGDGPAYQLRGMATRRDLARRGVGGALLSFAIGLFPRATRFWCNARVVAIPFYRRMGWDLVSEEFDIPGVGPHVRMAYGCNLPAGPRV